MAVIAHLVSPYSIINKPKLVTTSKHFSTNHFSNDAKWFGSGSGHVKTLTSHYWPVKRLWESTIKSTIKANEKNHCRSCEKFYIGKGTIYERSRQKLDRNDPETWNTKPLRGRWYEHRSKFQVMIVLAVVKDEQYALALENTTISHFMYKKKKMNDLQTRQQQQENVQAEKRKELM